MKLSSEENQHISRNYAASFSGQLGNMKGNEPVETTAATIHTNKFTCGDRFNLMR